MSRQVARGIVRAVTFLITIAALVPLRPGAARAAADDDAEERREDSRPREFRFELGVGGGYHWFAADHGLGRAQGDPTSLSPKSGPMMLGRLTLNFNNYVGVEVEGFLIPTTTRNEATNMWVFGGRGHFILNFVDSGPFRPFILAGAGTIQSMVDKESVVPNDLDGMFHAGIGFKLYFGDRVGLRLEGRGMIPPSAFSPLTSIGDENGYGGPDWEAIATLFFNFGEVERPRREIKKEVLIINQPAPPPAPAPVNPDPDGDGIAGDLDRCPNIAEDKDGFEDEDGCPEPDNDLDGIPDAQDKCPMKAETKNGVDDEDGCPEEDLDGDGFVGSRDKCPDMPETKNGYQDDDGCPDEIPVAVKKFTGVIEGINFKTKSAEILPGSYVILDRAVEVLKEYPDVQLEISGHTDDRGPADFNRVLSQHRADSVKNYLVLRGIDPSRLQSIGYGEDRPIADNRHESGRARNRRTEFRLISTGK